MEKKEIISFKSPSRFRSWLKANHGKSVGIWMQIFKKDSGIESITYAQAIDEALCSGWIDGQRRSFDKESYLQRFTPRRKRSIWSKINVGHVERLISEGRMQPAGLIQIEAAKLDGRWDKAYDSPKTSTVPEDFLRALKKNKKAEAFFNTLSKSNLYSITWRLQTAKKPETREADS